MKSIFERILRRVAVFLGVRIERARKIIALTTLPTFATPARGLFFDLPRRIENPHLIHLGDDVKLGPDSVLRARTDNPGSWLAHPEGEHVEQSFSPRVVIGDRVTATASLQIMAYDSITVGDDVLFASNVYVSDGTHATTRGDVPYKFQGIDGVAPVVIGRGSWIGQNAVILPGVTIGENAVIGANSVVARDVPDGGVAVGAPARVVKRWNPDREAWERADDEKVDDEKSAARTDTTPTTPPTKGDHA